MNEELDFEDYPVLHLHMMIDDYYELCEEGREKEIEREIKEYAAEEYHCEVDPQGRFSFCFND